MFYKSPLVFLLLTTVFTIEAAPVAELSELNAKAPSVRFEAHENKTEVERLKRLLKNSNRLQAKLQLEMDQMSDELKQMYGKFEKSDYEMSQIKKRQRELIQTIDTLRQQSQSAVAAPVAKNDPVTATNYQGNSEQNHLELDQFHQAMALYLEESRQADAEKALSEFLQQYPTSDMTVQAHYWLAQLYFKRNDDVKAVKHFGSVAAVNSSHKRADALMRMGDIAMRHNKKAGAKNYYRRVVMDYPNTEIAKLAQASLVKVDTAVVKSEQSAKPATDKNQAVAAKSVAAQPAVKPKAESGATQSATIDK